MLAPTVDLVSDTDSDVGLERPSRTGPQSSDVTADESSAGVSGLAPCAASEAESESLSPPRFVSGKIIDSPPGLRKKLDHMLKHSVDAPFLVMLRGIFCLGCSLCSQIDHRFVTRCHAVYSGCWLPHFSCHMQHPLPHPRR